MAFESTFKHWPRRGKHHQHVELLIPTTILDLAARIKCKERHATSNYRCSRETREHISEYGRFRLGKESHSTLSVGRVSDGWMLYFDMLRGLPIPRRRKVPLSPAIRHRSYSLGQSEAHVFLDGIPTPCSCPPTNPPTTSEYEVRVAGTEISDHSQSIGEEE